MTIGSGVSPKSYDITKKFINKCINKIKEKIK
jgi:hypothetical protein